MDNDTTQILNSNQNLNSQPKHKVEQAFQPQPKNESGLSTPVIAALTAGGAAVGAAWGVGAALAANQLYDSYVERQQNGSEENSTDEPTQNNEVEDTPIGMNEGVPPIAQVSDELPFNQAFEEAREQVGAGGVFYWRGRVYGTFYENEWNDMSESQRAEWESRIDYSEVMNGHEFHQALQPEVNQNNIQVDTPEESTMSNHTTTTSDSSDDEVHVVGVAIQDNGQGGIATLAALQNGEDMAVVVDVESDGRLDISIHDDNGNNSIEGNEIHDIRDDNLSTAEVIDVYVDETLQQGEIPVVHHIDTGNTYQIVETDQGYGLATTDDPLPNDGLYTASDDDTSNFVNNDLIVDL